MNEYQVTWERYRSWAVENMVKGAMLVMTVIWSMITLLCLALAMIAESGFKSLFFVLAVFGIYRAFFRIFVITKSQYRRLALSYGKENWTRRIVFNDDGITLSEGKASFHYDYSDIVNIREKGNEICLDASDKTVLRLYRDAFVESSWEECRSRLSKSEKDTAQRQR